MTTKGQWRTSLDFTLVTASKEGILEGSKKICDISEFGKSSDETKANAKLIAAAPEMLKALNYLVEKCLRTADTTLMHEELYNAQQSINKATK